MAKTGSQIAKTSEKKRGIQSTSFKFTQEEMALLDKLSQTYNGRKAAVVAGLIALDGGNAANSQAVAALLRKLADEVDPK